MEFDRTLARARALILEHPPLPLRTTLHQAEVDRISETLLGRLLTHDEAWRSGGKQYLRELEIWIERNEGERANVDYVPHFEIDDLPEHGLSGEQLRIEKEHVAEDLSTMQEALARGDISAVQDDADLLLVDFQINLDHKSRPIKGFASSK